MILTPPQTIALLASLTLLPLLVGCGRVAPEVADALSPQPTPLAFTAHHATNALLRVDALVKHHTPRDAGTPAGAQAAGWLQEQLQSIGVEAEVVRFEDETPRGRKTFANVIGTHRGRSDGWIVLLSHFDTKSGIGPTFQGANDSGSSTGLLLELASIIKNSGERHYNFLFGFMDGEECQLAYSDRDGFHGSKHFARALKKEGRNLKAVILTDMIGDRDLKINVPRNSSKELKLLALKAAATAGHRDKISILSSTIYDDHQAFLDLNFPAIVLIDFEFGSRPGSNDYWHTLEDSMDKLSAESLLTTGQIVVEMINMLCGNF
ncbi:MAG: M28 family peptidase [Kiritimatiellia bacterium]